MIVITRQPNADSRSAKQEITRESLRSATDIHIEDVNKGMVMFAELMTMAGRKHDFLKIEEFEEFYQALKSGKIKESQWYQDHITKERHHLISHVADDITLIDVFEHLVDCVMAGLSRSGEIYDIDLPDDVLQKAHKNTIELLKKNIKVVESDLDNIMDTKIN